MIEYLKIYGIATIIFFSLDMFWLGLISKGIYKKYLGFLMADNINWYAGITFYLLFIIGIMIFCIIPAINEHSLSKALILGALFGFFSYATYDLTNLATIKNWPLGITFIDLVWGTVLTSLVSAITYFITTIL